MRFSPARLAAGAALAVMLAAPAFAEKPFSFDGTPGKLPKTVVPTAYDIHLVTDIAKHAFSGSETVRVTVRKATARVALNTLDMIVSSASADGNSATKITTDNKEQVTTLSFAKPLAAGTHVLRLAYTGTMQRSPEGLFYQPYRDAAGDHVMISTQFESTDARRMFPSWDEPAFRATYQLEAAVPKAWMAVSNTPILSEKPAANDLKTVRFARTPKMSSYLVVLSAGDFSAIEGTSDGVKIRVVTPKGREETGRYALESAEKILAYYDDYFGIKFPLPKLDLIAIPGGFGGAMENWGGITFNERALLFDPKTSTSGAKQGVFAVIAHEMAHQWFGDLVTTAWWDNIWLNEGFASWMGTKATDHFNPEWNVWQEANGEKEAAMSADARLTTHPIQQPITNEAEAAASFDNITYLKGQSFLRMLETYLGEAPFRTGIREYMQTHKYSNTTTADLWTSLAAASHKPVVQLAAAWTERPGFPVVSVTAMCASGRRSLTLSQTRFLLSGTDPKAGNDLWYVPVGVKTASSATAKYTLLDTASGFASAGTCDEPFVVNAGNVGYYRVQYSPELAAFVQQHLADLSVNDRIDILGDSWALVQAGRQPSNAYLSLVKALGPDLNLVEWQQISTALGTLADYERGKPGSKAYDAYVRSVYRPLYDKLGWDAKPGDTVPTQQLRRMVVGMLGTASDLDILAESKTRFAAFQQNPSSVSPDDQGLLLGIIGSNADAATWDQLHTLARKATSIDEKQRYFGAMAAAKNDALAQKALDLSLTDEIPPQIAQFRIQMLAEVAGAHQQLAWAFFKAHNAELFKTRSTFEKILSFTSFENVFWNAAPVEEIEAYTKKNVPPEAYKEVAKATDRVKFRRALQVKLLPQVDAYVVNAAGPFTTK
jgi:aminopeptidase N